MTNPHSMIELKDISEKITNTREELINEQFANNPEKKRPLVFRGYIYEADRIRDTIKNHKYLYYLPDYEKIKREQKKLKILSPPQKINLNKIKIFKNLKSSSYDGIDLNEKDKNNNNNN